MELRLRWPELRKWGALCGLLTAGLLACRQPLPPPDPARADAATTDARKPPGTGGQGGQQDAPPAPVMDSGSPAEVLADASGSDLPGDVASPDTDTDMGAAEVARDMSPPDLGPAPGNCGLARPDLAMVTATGAMAVARDGTIYFAQSMGTDGFIGRLRPTGAPAMALSLRLVRIANGAKLTGMTIDHMGNVLYVGNATRGAVHRVNLAANPPTTSDLVIGVSPNDLVWNGNDRHVYYSEQSDRRIYRLSQIGARTAVTMNALPDAPGGLAFGPGGGDLYVGSASAGPITKITLAGGMETARNRFGTYAGIGDGLAFDGAGRLYVTAFAASGDSQVVRLDAAGTNPVTVGSGGQLSALAFGQGALDCRDLYVTSKPGAMLRLPVDIPGAH